MPLSRHIQKLIFPAFIICTLLIIGIIGFYIFRFSSRTLGSPEEFGQFGDYIGGLANPILSFFTIFLLLWSIKIQTDELKKTSDEMQRSAKAAEEQIKLIKYDNTRRELEETYKKHYQLSLKSIHDEIIFIAEYPSYGKLSINQIYLKMDKDLTLKKYCYEKIEKANNITDNILRQHITSTHNHLRHLNNFACKLISHLNDSDIAQSIFDETEEMLKIGKTTCVIDESNHKIYYEKLLDCLTTQQIKSIAKNPPTAAS